MSPSVFSRRLCEFEEGHESPFAERLPNGRWIFVVARLIEGEWVEICGPHRDPN